MAELTPQEKLQPCLLDRLTDEHPDEQRESRDQRVISLGRYREAVLRDLVLLLNASRRPAADEIYEYDEVPQSVINFGMRDLCGLTAAGVDPSEIEKDIVACIRQFEPRIRPDSLSVKAMAGSKSHGSSIAFEISGDLWAEPTPDHLYVKTEMDLETGRCELVSGKNG